MARSICSVDDCDNVVNGHGLCSKHYFRWRKHGDPLGGGRNHGPAKERFWRRVDVLGPSDCWIWTGAPTNAGYGIFQIGGKGSPMVAAHRFACEDAGTVIPEGMVVMHTCDVRLCCNPAHLVVGTSSENAKDMHAKGRANKVMPKGEGHCHAVLTADLVRYIRQNPSVSHAALAREIGVDPTTIRGVRIGRVWSHVT